MGKVRATLGVTSALCGLVMTVYGGMNLGKSTEFWSNYLVERVDDTYALRNAPEVPQQEVDYLTKGATWTAYGLGLLALGVIVGSSRTGLRRTEKPTDTSVSFYDGKPRSQQGAHRRIDLDKL